MEVTGKICFREWQKKRKCDEPPRPQDSFFYFSENKRHYFVAYCVTRDLGEKKTHFSHLLWKESDTVY